MQEYSIQFTDRLKKRGYRCLNEKRNNIYGRIEHDVIYVVALGYSDEIKSEDIIKFDNHIRSELSKKFTMDIRILNLIITDMGARGEFKDNIIEAVRNTDNVWIFANDYGKLFIYENQPDDFDNIKELLENFEKPSKKSYLSIIKDNTEIVTAILVIINVIIYIITSLNPDLEYELADNYYFVVVKGQYYRMLTSMFVHFGISHLINNMLILFIMGVRAERLMGKLSFSISYILTGVVASACSLYFSDIYTFSAGASGAICGVLGMLIIYAVTNKGNANGLSVGYLIFISAATILNGFTTTGIDNYAHIGGFIAGLIAGCISILIHNMVVKNKSM